MFELPVQDVDPHDQFEPLLGGTLCLLVLSVIRLEELNQTDAPAPMEYSVGKIQQNLDRLCENPVLTAEFRLVLKRLANRWRCHFSVPENAGDGIPTDSRRLH